MNQKGISKIGIGVAVAVIAIGAVLYFAFDRKSEDLKSASILETQSVPQGQSSEAAKISEPQNINNNESQPAKNNMHTITIETNLGEIKIQTYDADAPKTVQNFISLAGKGFYDNLTFHRVIDGFMIQGGDPNGNGSGGPGYQFEDELNPETESYKAGYKKGVVAMANAGPDTNGSQFFIMVADYPLQKNYSIFGKVISGQEVADKIAKVAKDSNDRPLEPVVMKKVTVQENK